MSLNPPTWTPGRIEQLKKLFEAGLTCAEIAREIDVTRNAVIGKLSRLGLSRPRDVMMRRAPRQQPRLPRPAARQGQVRILRSLHAAMAAAATPEPLNELPRCSLFELGNESCRWPIGRPGTEGFGFCGTAPVDGLPYCAGHAQLAYLPASRRRSA